MAVRRKTRRAVSAGTRSEYVSFRITADVKEKLEALAGRLSSPLHNASYHDAARAIVEERLGVSR